MIEKFLILFLLFHTISNGHIWVSQIYPEYQNEQYVKTINFQIALENGLQKNEILKIKLPFIVAIFNQISIKLVASTTELVQAVYQENLNSEQSFLIKVNQEIATNAWMNVVITAFTGIQGSTIVPSGFYQTNFQLSTHSGFDSLTQSVTGYQEYDYNYQAGQIEIAPPPITMKNVTMITNKANYAALTPPKSTNTAPVDSYLVYIDLTPQSYYPEGIYYISMIDTNFEFKGACTNIGHVCGVNDTGCVNITALLDGKWTCSITNNIIAFDIKTEILRNVPLRLTVTVSNPAKYIPESTSNGINVFLESRYAKYKFEYFSLTSIFATVQLPVITPTVTYLWGFEYATGETSGCPIGIYKSDHYYVWNKITVSVGVSTSLPTNSNGIIFYMQVLGIDLISETSIKTTFTALSSKSIICTPALITSSYFECNNIAEVTAATTYKVSFAFIVTSAKTPSDLINFESGNQITSTSTSLAIATKKLFVNSEYGSSWKNYGVFDTILESTMALTLASQTISAASIANGRSLMKFDNTKLIKTD